MKNVLNWLSKKTVLRSKNVAGYQPGPVVSSTAIVIV